MEVWKDVVGLIGIYQVSNLGRIKRVGSSRGARVGHILAIQPGGTNGKYLKAHFGRLYGQDYVHRVVAKAFLGLPPTERHEINHINGDTRDNRPDNLEWVTRSENNIHSYRILGRQATVPIGEKQWNSKLTASDIRSIRKLWHTGCYVQRELGTMFGVRQTTISRIVLNQSWKHIK